MRIVLVLALLAPTVATAQEMSPPSETAAKVRVADPWSTRGTVNVVGGVTAWSGSSMPFLTENEATANAASLGIDLYGRRVGFHLALAGSMSENAQSEDIADPRLRYTGGEARLALTATLWNSRGVFVGVGPGVEARATGIADSQGQSIAAWETVVAGGEAHGRVFLGRHVIVSGSAFAGVVPIAGEWQSSDTVDPAGAGSMEAMVFASTLAASLRPAEWIALNGGVAMRNATHTFEDGTTGNESTLRPFVGLQLLY